MAEVDLPRLRQWIGRERTTFDSLDAFAARALSAALDHEQHPKEGDPLAPGWQWLYFRDVPRASATASDGHPVAGDLLPPVPLPLRMWAAGNMEFLRPLTLGTPAVRNSILKSVDAKVGRSGTLVFLTVEHRILQGEELCIREEQSLVYRNIPTSNFAHSSAGEKPSAAAAWQRTLRPDPVLLFRYSALTYNAHRIHYDRTYAVEQELYPALIVQGPLLATLLLDLARSHLLGERITVFSFRALRPAYDSVPITACGKRESDAIALWIVDDHGELCMRATATIS